MNTIGLSDYQMESLKKLPEELKKTQAEAK